jgi:HTH-type transcriptional regulator/antitoxin HigA
MRIIKRGALEQFWRKHPNSQASLESWYAVVRQAHWKTPAEMKQVFPHADIVGRRVVFKIPGNHYRLVARVNYRTQCVFSFAFDVACGICQGSMEPMSTMTIRPSAKTNGKKPDAKTYGRLLRDALPRVIHSGKDYERLTGELMLLEDRAELGPEEQQLAELLTLLIDEYEEARYPIRKASPQQTLQHLMEARNLTQKDLLGVFGSKGIASEVFHGKRAVSKAQAKKLAEFFHVSAGLFI